MRRWYVVHSQPNGEARATFNLERQGFPVYLPRYLATRRHARRTARIPRPLFPRYLFVQLDPNCDRWRSVNGTYGVAYLVTHGSTPLAVPEGVVETIAAREDAEGVVELDQPTFVSGQRVEIVHGPMATKIGLFDHVADQERIVLLLNLLGRQVRVTLPHVAVLAA